MSTVFIPLADALGRDAHPIAAFSNGYEWDRWSGRWCQGCRHDNSQTWTNVGDAPLVLCPLMEVALLGRTPREWAEMDLGGLDNRYACSQYEPIDPEQDARQGI